MAIERIPITTDDQRRAIARFAQCSFLPGSFEKRFARDVAAQIDRGLTPKQYTFFRKGLFRYRVQLFGKDADTKQGKDRAQRTIDQWFPPLELELTTDQKGMVVKAIAHLVNTPDACRCSMCDGTGKWETLNCPRCEGTGTAGSFAIVLED